MSLSEDEISVLCVDDEPELADLIAMFIKRYANDVSTVTATNAHKGLEILGSGDIDIDCIVSDFDMPGMDGLAFLQAVRADYPDLPFILFTGRGSEEIASDAISAGVTDYMQKETGNDQYEVLANRVENVVAQHQARSQATEAHERAQIILNASPDAILVVTNGEVVYANPQAIDLLNAVNEDEITNQPLTDYIPIDDRSTVLDALDSVQRGNATVQRLQHSMETLDGDAVPVEVTARQITWDGQPGVVGIIRDISERVQREQELQETNWLLSALFEVLPVGVTVLNAEGQIIRANERAEEVLGLSKSDITERTYDHADWHHYDEDGDPIPRKELPFAQVMATGEPVFDYEHGIRWPDGSERWLTMHLAPIESESGDIERVVAVISDITDQYEYEQTLQQQNDQLEEFASIVSHDLRSPLATARGYSDLAREDGDPEYFERITHSLDRMERIIEDVLWLAREGREIGTKEEVDLAAAIEKTWKIVAPDGVDAELVYAAERLGSIIADYDRLCQLLENVLGNTIKHGGPGVTVRVERTENGFAIEDDGPGIHDSIREQVFEQGFTTADNGTGFGLHIVKQIAEAHGWQVTVTDSETGGARIEITEIERPPASE